MSTSANETGSAKEAYKAPRLTVFGSVTDLTAAGSSTKNENGGHPDGLP